MSTHPIRAARRARIFAVAAAMLASQALAAPRIAATTSELAALVREVGGSEVKVDLLARPTQDPHWVDPKPSLLVGLSRADAVVLNGMDLEVGWLAPLLTNARNPGLLRGQPGYIDASTFITPLEIPLEKLDRAMGDVHPGGNPHYLKDVRNGIQVAQGLAERLSKLDPPGAHGYRARAEAFAATARQKDAAWQALLAPYRGTPVVTFHKSWIYFVEWAGLVEVGFIEPKPGLPPSAGHVAKVLQLIRARKVPLILQEDWYSSATSRLLAEKTGAKLVQVPGSTPENLSYLEGLDAWVRAVVSALTTR